MTEYWRYF